jgi:hypothetical protein
MLESVDVVDLIPSKTAAQLNFLCLELPYNSNVLFLTRLDTGKYIGRYSAYKENFCFLNLHVFLFLFIWLLCS